MSRLFHFLAPLLGLGFVAHPEAKLLRHGLSADYWTRAPQDYDWRAELKARWEE